MTASARCWRVDGIITDRPDVLREVLGSRGQWAPMVSCHWAATHR
ncbi:MAG: hypothetical protein ACYDDU_11555 [Dermatophilaceae bacterium]